MSTITSPLSVLTEMSLRIQGAPENNAVVDRLEIDRLLELLLASVPEKRLEDTNLHEYHVVKRIRELHGKELSQRVESAVYAVFGEDGAYVIIAGAFQCSGGGASEEMRERSVRDTLKEIERTPLLFADESLSWFIRVVLGKLKYPPGDLKKAVLAAEAAYYYEMQFQNDSRTALLVGAASAGISEWISPLVYAEADPNAICSEVGDTSLTLAISNGHGRAAAELIKNGADVHAKLESGVNTLILASEAGLEPIAKRLIELGLPVNGHCSKGQRSPLSQGAKSGHRKVVELLLKNGAAPNIRGRQGTTPLLLASKYGHGPVVKTLLENGGEIGACRADKQTPLMAAAGQGHTEIVRTLLEAGSAVNSETDELLTALFFAAQNGHTEVVRLLCDNGADIGRFPHSSACPIETAASNGFGETVVELLGRHSEREALSPEFIRNLFAQIKVSGEMEVAEHVARHLAELSIFPLLLEEVRKGFYEAHPVIQDCHSTGNNLAFLFDLAPIIETAFSPSPKIRNIHRILEEYRKGYQSMLLPSRQDRFGAPDRQVDYFHWFIRSIATCALFIEGKQAPITSQDVQELLTLMANRRGEIAVRMKSEDEERFGRFRLPEIGDLTMTPVYSEYQSVANALFDRLPKIYTDLFQGKGEPRAISAVQIHVPTRSGLLCPTKVQFYKEKVPYIIHMGISDTWSEPLVVDWVADIVDLLNSTGKLSTEELRQAIAEIHGKGAHACILKRGSAAISELLAAMLWVVNSHIPPTTSYSKMNMDLEFLLGDFAEAVGRYPAGEPCEV